MPTVQESIKFTKFKEPDIPVLIITILIGTERALKYVNMILQTSNYAET